MQCHYNQTKQKSQEDKTSKKIKLKIILKSTFFPMLRNIHTQKQKTKKKQISFEKIKKTKHMSVKNNNFKTHCKSNIVIFEISKKSKM